MLDAERLRQIQEELKDLPKEEQQKRMNEILEQLEPEELEELRQQQCPFCLIKEGRIDTKIVYNDDLIMGVLDINPANKGHIILFPKDHYSFLSQMNDNLIGHIFIIANKLSQVVINALNAEGVNFFIADGQVAGQTVPHLLVHIIPRFKDDNIDFRWNGKSIPEGEMKKIHEKIIEGVRSFGEVKEEIKEEVVEYIEDYDEERVP